MDVQGVSLSTASNMNVQGASHGIINYIDTKAKYLHLNKMPVKGLCVRCLLVWNPLSS
jgi:hypothetical protein